MKTAWLALLAGCSAGPIALDGFVAAYADAVCSAQARCLPRAAYLDEECRAAATAFFASDLQKAVATQRVNYSASKARECVEVLAAARCVPDLARSQPPLHWSTAVPPPAVWHNVRKCASAPKCFAAPEHLSYPRGPIPGRLQIPCSSYQAPVRPYFCGR